jgi:hypothetical protein
MKFKIIEIKLYIYLHVVIKNGNINKIQIQNIRYDKKVKLRSSIKCFVF